MSFCENYISFLKMVPNLVKNNTYQAQIEVSPEINPAELVGADQFEKSSGNFQTFACRSLKIYNEFLPRLLRRPLVPNIQPG